MEKTRSKICLPKIQLEPGTLIEMFALKVDLCDKCDPSQMKGLVRYFECV